MYDWEDLVEVYSEWRWKIYKSASKNRKYVRTLRKGVKLRLHCNITTRLKFSEYAGLTHVISKRDMDNLETNFWEEY